MPFNDCIRLFIAATCWRSFKTRGLCSSSQFCCSSFPWRNFCIELPSFKAWKELRILVISETIAASGFVFRVGNVSWPVAVLSNSSATPFTFPNSSLADFCVAVVFAKAACVSRWIPAHFSWMGVIWFEIWSKTMLWFLTTVAAFSSAV